VLFQRSLLDPFSFSEFLTEDIMEIVVGRFAMVLIMFAMVTEILISNPTLSLF
jgi:hypothetical protein